jgi:hypothetical protein
MTSANENAPISDDCQFDLLVDGELTESKRRELLSGLDDEPGGWRRCALAFLEAQSWKQEFGAMVGDPAAKPRAGRRAWRPPLSVVAGTVLAIAASFLAALWLAGPMRAVWRSGIPAARPPGNTLVSTEGVEAPGSTAGPAETHPPALPEQPRSDSAKVWMVDVPGSQGPEGQRRPIPLLAVERDHLDEDWLQSFALPVPPELVKQLSEVGLRLEQRRELLPYWMKDGRRLIVPVEEVEIRCVGRPTF